jgi:hypothetical protein
MGKTGHYFESPRLFGEGVYSRCCFGPNIQHSTFPYKIYHEVLSP